MLPIVWVLLLPRLLIVVQVVPLAMALAWFIYTWLY
jgi:hypothetical protein